MGFWDNVINNQMQGMDAFSAYEKAKRKENEPCHREIRFLDWNDKYRLNQLEYSYRREGCISVNIDFDEVRDDLDSHRYIGAVEGDNVVGIISVGGTDGYPDLDPKGAIISDLYVSPDRRNNNIGSELVEEAVRYAKREYGNKIYADILDDGLLYFYKKLGFKENGEGHILLDYSPKQKSREDI